MAERTLDARGLKCPLPVLKAARILREMAKGEMLEVMADDPGSVSDMPDFCREAGHRLLEAREENGEQLFRIQKE